MGREEQNILVLDLSPEALRAVHEACLAHRLRVERGAGADAALARARSGEVDLVLLDLCGEPGPGLEWLRALRAAPDRRHLPVFVLTAAPDGATCLRALEEGADDVVALPADPRALGLRLVRSLAHRARVDALLQEAEALHHLSVTDGLTGTHNHRFFQERLKEEFRRAQRYDDPLSLALLDIDHFKRVNDVFGHPVGDEVLKDVARCIRRAVRDTDLVCRYGGEEFAVLLPRTHLAGALTVAERMWRGIAALRAGAQAQVQVTASLGISGYPSRQVLAADQLLGTADEALYRAKREGRNKICLSGQPSFLAASGVSR
jgi:two-component system cell cycle response regulator